MKRSLLLLPLLTLGASAFAADAKNVGYQDTPMQPNGKWHVHDGLRPQPKVITPPTPSTQDKVGTPPSDAVVLFDGKNLDQWRKGKDEPAGWDVIDGAMVVKKGAGDILTKGEFGDCQLHVEWSAATPPRGDSQARSNSGIFLFGRYEFQVLDCYENPTYPDGQAGSIYGQTPPLVNASRKPGEWQTYDIVFTAPRFAGEKLEKPAYVTIIHNGIIVQNHTELTGETPHRQVGTYKPHGPKGPIKLQDHGDPVRFRNIWIRELKPVDSQ